MVSSRAQRCEEIPTIVVNDLFGHSSATTTERYYSNSKPALRAAGNSKNSLRERNAIRRFSNRDPAGGFERIKRNVELNEASNKKRTHDKSSQVLFCLEVPKVGVEPTRPCGHWILNLRRLLRSSTARYENDVFPDVLQFLS